MTNKTFDIVVVGSGVFGAASAVELALRGHTVALVDAGPIPHPLAASTDISKVVRMEYGADELYMEMLEDSLPIWREWNESFGEQVYFESGVAMLSRAPMSEGSFEQESYNTLRQRGHKPERLDADEISSRFPMWRPGAYVDGFFHEEGGFALSGRVVSHLAERADTEGVEVIPDFEITSVVYDVNSVAGVRASDGRSLSCGCVVIAAGPWSRQLVPELRGTFRSTGHPVFHLRPADPGEFEMTRFPTFMADVSKTGWYGFPLHPTEHVVKIANHGIGLELDPDDARIVGDEDITSLRQFADYSFTGLAEAEIVYTRRCLYCDTLDAHFLIDRHPSIEGLVVATGGSGHGFKFAPVLGPLIADAVEGIENKWLPRFVWRELSGEFRGEEATRHRG